MQYQAPVVEHHERIDEQLVVGFGYDISSEWEDETDIESKE
jgi:hypothetical protein